MQQRKIAIIGYGYIMPGAIKNDQQFWEFLTNRKVVREPVEQRYGKGYAPLDGYGGSFKFASPYESLITDGDELAFDCKLFGLSPKEAGLMDPQIKMMLTTTWRALEQAGQDQLALRNSDTGVFVGTQVSSAAQWRTPTGANEFTIPGQSIAMIANRISYHFNWMGPSLCTMTACSAGLTALNVAVNALSNGECSMAVAGGVNYLGCPSGSTGFNALGIVSPNGIGRSFDAHGDGYVRAEGAFSYILKPLEDAERDGDFIHAVIRATRCNTAGAMDGTEGYSQGRYITAPTEHAQMSLMQETCRQAGLVPADIDYLEAHATGTPVGDRVEGNAIGRVFQKDRAQPLRVASVKSNVGHMEAASFSVGLLKALMMFKHRTFAPISESFQEPNPEIDFVGYNMAVQTECEAFPDRPVVVGINSFGFGGANAHCILEEYSQPAESIGSSKNGGKDRSTEGCWYSIPLSAKTESALLESAKTLGTKTLGTSLTSTQDFKTIVGNLSSRRSHFPIRTAITARTEMEFRKGIETFLEDQKDFTIKKAPDEAARILMVFSGQGTQWSGCGRALYASEPVFKRVVDAIDEQWLALFGESLKDIAFTASKEDLNECRWAQPSIFMIQAALYELLKTWGVYADVVVGHSAGEVGAAYASGAFSLEDACRLVHARSRAQQKTANSGRMLVIGLQLDALKAFLAEQEYIPVSSHVFQKASDPETIVELACENSPESNVLCAPESILQPLIEALNEHSIQNTLIPGNIAFHSHFMEPIRDEILTSLAFLSEGKDEADWDYEVPFVSTVSAQVENKLDARYWWSNVRQCVRLYPAMQQIQKQFQPNLIIEVSPHLALRAPISQCYQAEDLSVPEYLPTLIRDQNCGEYFARCLGALFQANVALDYKAQFPGLKPVTHLLPGHPMEMDRVVDSMIDDRFFQKNGDFGGGPLIGKVVQDNALKFETNMSARNYAWMADHVVHKLPIVPAAGYIEMIFQALGGVPALLEEVTFLKPCPVNDTAVWLQTELEEDQTNPNRYRFTISSRHHEQSDPHSQIHCVGWVVVNADNESVGCNAINDHVALKDVAKSIDLENALSEFEQCAYENSASFYGQLGAVLGDYFQYGEQFQVVDKIHVNPENKQVLLHLEMDETLWKGGRDLGYHLHPAILDGVLQCFLYYQLQTPDMPGIPRELRNFFFLRPPASNRLVVHYEPPTDWSDIHHKGQLTPGVGERPCGRVSVYDAVDGELVALLDQYITFNSNDRQADLARCQHYMGWQPKSPTRSPDLVACIQQSLNGDESSTVATQVPAILRGLREYGHPQQGQDYFLHVLEICEHECAKELVLNHCLEELSSTHGQYEYCTISSDQSVLTEAHEKFQSHKAPLRFEHLDIATLTSADLAHGLLRPAMAECVIWRMVDTQNSATYLKNVSTLLAPGGFLVLIADDDLPSSILPASWTPVAQSADRRLLIATSPGDVAEPVAESIGEESGKHWIVGAQPEVVNQWLETVIAHEIGARVPTVVGTDETFTNTESITRIDYFDALSQESDPLGLRRVSDFGHWVQRLVRSRGDMSVATKCKVTIFTQQAQQQVTDPGGASLWGAVRSLALEVAESAQLDFRLVDIGELSDLSAFAATERSDWREQELLIRNSQISCHRFYSEREPYHALAQLDVQEPAHYHLALDYPGQISGLRFKARTPKALLPEEVEVEIQATALNFRDIMVMLGRLPLLSFERSALGRNLGMEASGIVRKTGSSVRKVSVGDRVLVMQGGCIANRVRCHEDGALPAPTNTTLTQAAALASVYVTAYYALVYLSRMKKGQSLLVHSAMGGVGQAAIALANHIGVKVYATAGSAEKRQRLREMGVVEAFDSHSYDWHQQLMEATDGEGVDIILNSLAGFHIELCLESLKPGGWHCEIGKMDIYANNTLGLKIFRKNLRFVAIDVDRLMADDPQLARELCLTCLDLVEQGQVPPLDVTTYSFTEYESAMRCMMNGQHTGKLVLCPPDSNDSRAIESLNISDERLLFKKDASYLLSGCLGGFGLRFLSYLVSMGARHILLLDRDASRRRSEHWLRANANIDELFPDINIEIVYADVADSDHVDRAIDLLDHLNWPELKGVFHLAGVLDDKLLNELDEKSYETVFKPKAQGAWNLHQSTQHMDLDWFVTLSSISAVFGNPSQTNYAAANTYLDSLAAMRRGLGMPALTYNMSAISDAGMASRSPHVLRMMKTVGTPAISSIFAIEVLDSALRKSQRSANVVSVLPQRFSATVSSADYLRVGHLISNNDAFSDGDNSALSREAILERIVAQFSQLCGHDEIDVQEPLSNYGLNSISVVELGAFIKTEFDQSVSALELMTSATCETLVDKILDSANDDSSSAHSGNASSVDSAEESNPTSDQDSEVAIENAAPSKPLQARRVPSRFQISTDLSVNRRSSAGRLESLKTTPCHGAKSPQTTIVVEPSLPHSQQSVIGKLDGRLPPDCEKDLASITEVIREKLLNSDLQDARPIEQARAVLLTGATGFIGRLLLHELCSSTTDLRIHCLIRGESEEHAWQRLEDAMRLAEIWHDDYRQRIVVHVGDISEPQLGLDDIAYAALCEAVDAVYHFAADVKLAASYAEIRNANTRSMRNILALCLEHHQKSIFYASTMGIFPQYFCTFANEFEHTPIESQAMPSLAEMKRMFPMGIIGYPWSKLVVEQALLAAHRQGLPVGIFRIPQTAISADTGYSQHSDIKLCLVNAVLETRSKPENLSIQWSEPVDTVCQFVRSISLNPERRNLIYHCCHDKPTSTVTELEQLGFELEECSYQSFKDRCLALGKDSALHGYWVLLDHFAPYWMSDRKSVDNYPVSVDTLHADSSESLNWPGMLQSISRSLDWARRHTEHWPHGIASAELHVEGDVSVDEPFQQAHARLLDALALPDASIKESKKSAICFDLYRKRLNVDNLRRLRRNEPAIAEQNIERPVFILGMNRTGTTFLHRLMSQTPQFQAPRPYEFLDVAHVADADLLTENDPRRAFSEDLLSVSGAKEALEGIHTVRLDDAEEEFSLLENAFISHSYSARFNIPEYDQWLAETSHKPAYRLHFEWMQYLSWQRREAGLMNDQRWLLKMPFHLFQLEALLDQYPDAVIIQTHRDPSELIPSWCHLVESLRNITADNVNRAELGQQQLASMQRMINGALEFRTTTNRQNQWLDVSYYEFIKSPLRTVAHLYESLGYKFDQATESTLQWWLFQQQKQRAKEKRHEYRLQDYALTQRALDGDFADYYAFLMENNILSSKRDVPTALGR